MSLRVIGYSNGRRNVVDEGPARARVSGYGQGNTHDLTLIGSLVQGEPGEVEQKRQAAGAARVQAEAADMSEAELFAAYSGEFRPLLGPCRCQGCGETLWYARRQSRRMGISVPRVAWRDEDGIIHRCPNLPGRLALRKRQRT